VWAVGKLCTISSRLSTVRFQGPLRYHSSFVAVAPFGGPYRSISCRATFLGAAGYCSTRGGHLRGVGRVPAAGFGLLLAAHFLPEGVGLRRGQRRHPLSGLDVTGIGLLSGHGDPPPASATFSSAPANLSRRSRDPATGRALSARSLSPSRWGPTVAHAVLWAGVPKLFNPSPGSIPRSPPATPRGAAGRCEDSHRHCVSAVTDYCRWAESSCQVSVVGANGLLAQVATGQVPVDLHRGTLPANRPRRVAAGMPFARRAATS
jgi:hypothetical protein